MTRRGPDAVLPVSDPAPSRLELQGRTLAYVDEGPRDAPALLAVHGIPGSVRDFRYLAPQLVPGVRFIRVDLPGFGDSTPHRPAVTRLEGRADALVELADHLGLARFAVLGHSMGGATALVTAARHGARVSALVLVASVGLRPHRGLGMSPRRFRLLGHGFKVPLLRRLFVRAARDRYERRRLPGASAIDARTFAVHFEAIGAADFDLLRRIASGPLPRTLLAFARDDHMVDREIQEELAAALKHARILAFEEGGHNIQKTRAVELGRATLELLGVA
ncbi:MAG TPA: alpha/beta fold hydrolase [Vicinamibacteria bacterium]|nr:alpha/beta fold hydrolase [Vicinamibacteria bacterium]